MDLTRAMTVYFLLCHSHYTKAICSVVMQWSACCSPTSRSFLCLPSQLAEFASGLLFYGWSLLRGNYRACNTEWFTSSYGSRCFVACACWTQTVWRQIIQRDSDYR